jgi:hypothetical protein
MLTQFSMNRLVALLALAFCLPLTAHADDASRRAKAQQMIDLLHTDRMVEQVNASILKQMSDAAGKLLGPNPTAQNQTRLADFEKKVSQATDAELGWKTMQPSFIDLYSKTFTEPELDAIIAFYSTPAGTALLNKMPSIDAQATQLEHSRMVVLQPQLGHLFDDFRKSQSTPSTGATPAPSAAPLPSAAPTPATSTPK